MNILIFCFWVQWITKNPYSITHAISFSIHIIISSLHCMVLTHTHIVGHPTQIHVRDVVLGQDLDEFRLWMFVVIPECRVTVHIRVFPFIHKYTIVWNLKYIKNNTHYTTLSYSVGVFCVSLDSIGTISCHNHFLVLNHANNITSNLFMTTLSSNHLTLH